MGLNLHSIVRPAINSVNPEQLIAYYKNIGFSDGLDGTQTPQFAAVVNDVPAQVQPLSKEDLKHPNMANVQGVTRAVYMFGNTQGVVRVDAKGGDILRFPQDLGDTVRDWLVVAVLETWNPDTTGWCKVGVSLQVTNQAAE